jgi:2-keto-4-pentenoate hydratase/2-oxohepta-3-ene-1,7-dioic acid hydratase in catechol pathway
MKIARFDENRLGVVIGDEVHDVTSVLRTLPPLHYPAPLGDAYIRNLVQVREQISHLLKEGSAPSLKLCEVQLLSPVANPSKIIAAPINYQSHIDQDLQNSDIAYNHTISHISNAGLFLKATSSLAGAGQGVKLHDETERNDHEIELVVVIGKQCKNISRSDYRDVVAGYAIGLDMTVRGPQDRSFRKSHDTYSILGPWLTTADEMDDPDHLDMELSINAETRQSVNTSSLVYSVGKLIEYASHTYTLYPGDLVFTGTPHGVGPVRPGDVMRCRISGLGEMAVTVHES